MERAVVITPAPNQPEHQPVRCCCARWSPRNEECVLHDRVPFQWLSEGAWYEQYGQHDQATDFPVVAVSMQPRDLAPPSSFARTASRRQPDLTSNGRTMKTPKQSAAQTLEDSNRLYGHDDEGSDRNSEDEQRPWLVLLPPLWTALGCFAVQLP